MHTASEAGVRFRAFETLIPEPGRARTDSSPSVLISLYGYAESCRCGNHDPIRSDSSASNGPKRLAFRAKPFGFFGLDIDSNRLAGDTVRFNAAKTPL